MIIAIVGPTASHKSDLADKLSVIFDSDIINFDAFQVYKELNVGSAKPSKEVLKDKKYKLYDFVSINEDYDVSKYQIDGRNALKEKGNHILVGGTGLYLKACLFDYKFLEEDPMPNDFLCDLNNQKLYEMLYEIDKDDALKIGNNNRKRLLRALYIYKIHGKNKSELNNNGKDKLLYDNVIFIGLNPLREELYKNIDNRVDKMFELGLKDEVNYLFANFDKTRRGLQAIGYKEFDNNLPIEEIKELIKKNTRNYAKRQLTFFKHQFNINYWFTSVDEAVKYIQEHIDEFNK